MWQNVSTRKKKIGTGGAVTQMECQFASVEAHGAAADKRHSFLLVHDWICDSPFSQSLRTFLTEATFRCLFPFNFFLSSIRWELGWNIAPYLWRFLRCESKKERRVEESKKSFIVHHKNRYILLGWYLLPLSLSFSLSLYLHLFFSLCTYINLCSWSFCRSRDRTR